VKLPGSDQAARIAKEMAAMKPPSPDGAPAEPPAPPDQTAG
jgi:hypothetical protein